MYSYKAIIMIIYLDLFDAYVTYRTVRLMRTKE
jgi:hypothetical protein